MVVWTKKVTLFLLLLVIQANATTSHAPRASAAPPTNQWMHAMEASVHAVRVPDSKRDLAPVVGIAAQGGIMAWLGWLVAGGCFVIMMSAHRKVRRRERLLMRGGSDLYLLRPSRKRRR